MCRAICSVRPNGVNARRTRNGRVSMRFQLASRIRLVVTALGISAAPSCAQRDTLSAPPDYIGDTLSKSSQLQYEAQARRQCDKSQQPPRGGSTVISSDTLKLTAVTPCGSLDRVWQELEIAGVKTLPPRIKRPWAMLDGYTYVAQLRAGREYRVSRIEHVEHPILPADRAIQQLNTILGREIGWRN